jgi:putative SOS response-associated peptidase YedK
MPFIVPPASYAEWLDPANQDVDCLDRLLGAGGAGNMTARPVGRRVGNARNEGPDLIEPVEPIRPAHNLQP